MALIGVAVAFVGLVVSALGGIWHENARQPITMKTWRDKTAVVAVVGVGIGALGLVLAAVSLTM